MRWVVIIVAISIIAMGAVVATIVVGSETFESTVVDDPYARGLAFDEDRALRQASGLAPQVVNDALYVGDNALVLRLQASGAASQDLVLRATLTRPHTGAQDRRLELTRDAADGTYRGPLSLSEAGPWELALEVDTNGDTVRFRRPFVAEPSR